MASKFHFSSYLVLPRLVVRQVDAVVVAEGDDVRPDREVDRVRPALEHIDVLVEQRLHVLVEVVAVVDVPVVDQPADAARLTYSDAMPT